MKRIFCIIFLIYSSVSYGQRSRYNPFKLVIISPDTAIIDKSLEPFIDSVQLDHLNTYYSSLKRMEKLANSNDYLRDDMGEKEAKEIKLKAKYSLDIAKKHEGEVRQFKYYSTISEYSTSIYQFYFNEYPPFSIFQLIKMPDFEVNNLAYISDSLNADYVIGYKNIFTENNEGTLVIKLTTILYSKEANKLLLEKETTGDTNSYGEMWTCSNPLSCLLVTAVKSSTESVFEILRNKQLRH